MAAAEKVEFSLRVMINREKTKVLFADVDNHFADVLLSFLTLPLGTIVRLLGKHYGNQAAVGSLNTLYDSLANLDNAHFWTEAGKLMLLNPRSSFEDQCRRLKLNIDDTQPTKYFVCEDWNCNSHRCSRISMYYGTATCRSSGKKMKRELEFPKWEIENQDLDDDRVFTIKTASFLISDDLKMVPNFPGSIIQKLSDLGITDIHGTEQRTVIIGFNEIMDLLKGSLLSNTSLTDLILHKTQTDTPKIKFEPLHQIENEETSNSKKMILKVMVQKSTHRFLFAEAEEDFVDFLFSFLTIPLAGVECLLGGNSCLRNIDNLYSSSANLNKYLKTQATENIVFNPKLAPMYLSKNQIFPLSAQNIPELYFHYISGDQGYVSFGKPKTLRNSYSLVIADPRGQGSYVRGPGMFIVTDDLTVTPLFLSSSVSILNGMKIKLSDVKELEIFIGLEEGLSILKASLTSTRALSNGLSSVLMKQPELEPGV